MPEDAIPTILTATDPASVPGSLSSSDQAIPAKVAKAWPGWIKPAIKLVIGGIVLWAVGRQLAITWDRWQSSATDFDLNLTILISSGIAYACGLIAFGIYYARVVQMVAPETATVSCLKAYILSHPAKYVPGKGMVVVIRVGLLARAGVRPTAAMLTALYETLSMMSIGGLLAGVMLFMPPSHWIGALLSWALGAAFLCTVLPLTFGRAARVLKKGLHAIEPGDLPKPTRSGLMGLLFWGMTGWLFWGMSQVLVVAALAPENSVSLAHWPRIMGAMMLGTVGGFALPVLPGGIGLREWIIDELTAGVIGPDLAIASALGLRFVWVVAELVAAAVVALMQIPLKTGPKPEEPSKV